MPLGGTITIGTERAEEGVRITVSDNGVRMDEEVRSRVFETFFTEHRCWMTRAAPGLVVEIAHLGMICAR